MSRSKTITANPTTQKAKAANKTFKIDLLEVKPPVFDINAIRYSPYQWVNYGDNNLYPEYLLNLLSKSPNHSAFIHLRETMIKGSGVTYSDNLKEFFENLDEEGQTIDDLIETVATDLSILETFAIAVRYNKTKDKIICLDYIDSSKVRIEKILQSQEEIESGVIPSIKGYWLSVDWINWTVNTPVYYEKFNPNEINSTTQLYFYHKKANGQPYYPVISYASCMNHIETDSRLGKHILNTVNNGFNPSGILNITASQSEEEVNEFQRMINDKFQRPDNAGSILTVVNESADFVKFTPFNANDETPKLKAEAELTQAAICTAHRGQPILAGIQAAGASLGGDGNLMKQAQDAFFKGVIVHLQKPILSFLQKVLKFNGFTDKKEYQLAIQSVNFASEDTPEWFLQDEVKPEILAARYGFKPEDLITPNPVNPAIDNGQAA